MIQNICVLWLVAARCTRDNRQIAPQCHPAAFSEACQAARRPRVLLNRFQWSCWLACRDYGSTSCQKNRPSISPASHGMHRYSEPGHPNDRRSDIAHAIVAGLYLRIFIKDKRSLSCFVRTSASRAAASYTWVAAVRLVLPTQSSPPCRLIGLPRWRDPAISRGQTDRRQRMRPR